MWSTGIWADRFNPWVVFRSEMTRQLFTSREISQNALKLLFFNYKIISKLYLLWWWFDWKHDRFDVTATLETLPLFILPWILQTASYKDRLSVQQLKWPRKTVSQQHQKPAHDLRTWNHHPHLHLPTSRHTIHTKPLRSSHQFLLTISQTYLTSRGGCSFTALTQKLWNNLPLRSADSVEYFKKPLIFINWCILESVLNIFAFVFACCF